MSEKNAATSSTPLDLGPYRKRLRDFTTGEVITLAASATLQDAAILMGTRNVGALLVSDGAKIAGILTERDLTRAMAKHGDQAPGLQAQAVMTRAVISMRDDALLFRGLGRMRRLNLRYLPTTDQNGRYTGVLSARALLKQRAAEAQMVADGIDTAASAEDLAHAREALPNLTRTLLDEKLAAHEIAAVISSIYADVSARAAALAEAEIAARLGPAPAAWCFMVLGSGGRGESLLSPDQDNAIIHAGTASDDGWFRVVAERTADILDAAGIPYCKGGVMAKNDIWRGNVGDWNTRIGEWIQRHSAAMLLNVDIFYDLRPVYGDLALGEGLRKAALEAARQAPMFLRLMAEQSAQLHPAIGLFGRLVEKDGRVDLKIGGLLPLVSAGRLIALKTGNAATSTRDRLAAAGQGGLINDEDLQKLLDAHELIMNRVLRQQLTDLGNDIAPSSRIEKAALKRRETAALKAALSHLSLLPNIVQDALTKT